MATLGLSALTPISASIPSSERPGLEPGVGRSIFDAAAPEGLGQMGYWADVVRRGTACDLPGCSIKYENFLTVMWRTVQRGNLLHDKAAFVADGLKNGFTLGIDVKKMFEHRSFKNYKSATEASASVAKAVHKRVAGFKTLDLGRCTPALEAGIRSIIGLLQLNMGKGYYSYDNFVPGITVATDASRGKFSGGGFVCSDGRYDSWTYGTRAARRLIDFFEGDTVVEAIRRCCAGWRGRSVKFLVDNSSFEKSGEKGRSRAERLNDLLKEILMLQIVFGFVIVFEWISTTRNRLADHVSRDREADWDKPSGRRPPVERARVT